MFCPDCGTLLRPSGGQKVCPEHGAPGGGSASDEPKIIKGASREKEVAVIEEKGAGLPEDKNEECPECRNQGAYYYERQTRAADEATTRFYICSDCDHRWRDYQ